MSPAQESSGPPDPRDPFGRRLLTLVGLVMIASGVAQLWLADGTSAVAAGVPLITIGVGLIVMAAFFYDVGGIVRYFNSEIWFGRGREDQDAVDDGDVEEQPMAPPSLVEDTGNVQTITDETPSSERAPPPEDVKKEAS
jgi:hypothetical protein